MTLRELHLFAGIGGGILGGRTACAASATRKSRCKRRRHSES